MVVGADGKVAPRTVKIGSAQGTHWVVLDGLKAGEQVMVDGFQKLRGRAPVKPVPWQPRGRAAAAPASRAAASARRRRAAATRIARMAKFFIDRPIFAWVIALFIIVLGGVAITQLPIAQYPPVAPPVDRRHRHLPRRLGADAGRQRISVIEQEMNGSPGLIYMESVSQANGSGQITLTFEPGTNPDLAQVDVQNRLSRATPRLPEAVTQQGVRVDKARSNFLLFTILSSDDPALRPDRAGRLRLAQRAARNPAHPRRRPGAAVRHRAGDAHLDRSGQAGRLQPVAADVNAAIRAQNAQVSSGTHRRPAERRRPGDRAPPWSSTAS